MQVLSLMEWNREKPEWTEFRWDRAGLIQREERFMLETGLAAGTLRHLSPEERGRLAADAMSLDAVATSEIEGEMLDRVSVQSSISNQLGLSPEKRRLVRRSAEFQK